jgi:hypothetical protein
VTAVIEDLRGARVLRLRERPPLRASGVVSAEGARFFEERSAQELGAMFVHFFFFFFPPAAVAVIFFLKKIFRT